MSDSDDAYGPPLPPGFGGGSTSGKPSKRAASSDSEDSSDVAGPALPPGFKKQRVGSAEIGPVLPPHLRKEDGNTRRREANSTKSPGALSDKAVIGPVLPPHLAQSRLESDSEEDCYGPALPAHLRTSQRKDSSDSSGEDSYGPALPPGFLQGKSSSGSASTSSRGAAVGPALPPHLREPGSSADVPIGPSLPPHMRGQASGSSGGASTSTSSGMIGPCLPPHLRKNVDEDSDGESDDDNDDGCVIGPSPSEMFTGSNADYIASQLERRAQKMKDKLANKDQDIEGLTKREAWMTELPPEMSGQIGLTARTFRKHSRPENKDRSVWTDTPADKARKEREASERGEDSATPKMSAVEVATLQKDQKYAEMIDDYNKSKRGESLLEMHKKEKKKKKKKEKEKPKERRPFDRDLDLQVNRFDDAQRKSLIKKAQGFNSRFQAGKTTSHFL